MTQNHTFLTKVKFIQPAVFAVLFVAVMALAAGSAQAKVAATVDGSKIMDAEVKEAYNALPEENRPPLEQAYSAILQRLIDQRLLDLAAEKEGIAKEKDVKENLALIRSRLLRDEYLRRQLEDVLSEKKVKERYKEMSENYSGKEEVRARHILVEKESEAKKIIEDLKKGADFAELAAEKSTGPSSSRGGDLGYFVRESMVPSFSNAAFNLEPGKYTEAPVQTRFGWHVIKVEDKRVAKAPEYDRVKQQIAERLRDEEIQNLVNELRKDAEVVLEGKE